MGVSFGDLPQPKPNLVRLRAKERNVDNQPYFCKYRNMENGSNKRRAERGAKKPDKVSAMGTEPRLRITQLLLAAQREGLVAGDIQGELGSPDWTVSKQLDKLKYG